MIVVSERERETHTHTHTHSVSFRIHQHISQSVGVYCKAMQAWKRSREQVKRVAEYKIKTQKQKEKDVGGSIHAPTRISCVPSSRILQVSPGTLGFFLKVWINCFSLTQRSEASVT